MSQGNNEDKTHTPKKHVLSNISITSIIICLICWALPRHPGKDISKHVICRSNLGQISLLVRLYSHDNDGSVPTAEKWNDMIVKYMVNEKLYRCPLIEKQAKKTSAYVLNRNIKNLEDLNLADMVLLFEGQPGWNQTGGVEDMVYRHGSKSSPSCNVAFADGHVERVKKSEAGKLKWESPSAD